MFKVNDSVIHCREGLSTIVGVNNMNGKDYFLVSVNRNSGETIYVPVDTANNIIRPLMNKKPYPQPQTPATLTCSVTIDTFVFFKILQK